jgi:hypothetical protein
MDTLKRTAHELEELRLALIARDNAEHFEPVLQGQDAGDWEFEQASRRASELITELDRQLTAEAWPPAAEMRGRWAEGSWVYGSVLRRAPLREITRGFLEPVRRVPLVSAVPEKVALYLFIMLPGGHDGLDRDLHGGIGYHYHYLNGKRQRSNVILSFDTRWTPPAKVPKSSNEYSWPLFVETHAEGKAHFKAKLDLPRFSGEANGGQWASRSN